MSEDAARVNTHDVVDEPESLLCPITRSMFRDPAFVAESGNTYERDALYKFWDLSSRARARDPLTNEVLKSRAVYTNWDKRREVAAWLDAHPGVVPSGWVSRETPPPRRDEGQRTNASRPSSWLARALGNYAPVKVVLLAVLASVALSHAKGASERGRGTGASRAPTLEEFGNVRTQRAPAGSSRVRIREVREVDAFPAGAPALEVYVGTTKDFGSSVANFGFSAVWMAITGTWTWGALAASPLFATFSVPFWLVGFSMLHSGATSALETSRLLITPTAFYLEKTILSRRMVFYEGETRDLTRAATETYAYVNGAPQNNLVLHQGVKSHVLARGLHVVEDEFIIDAVDSFLKKYQGRVAKNSREKIMTESTTPRARM